jgi:hypothetical protein
LPAGSFGKTVDCYRSGGSPKDPAENPSLSAEIPIFDRDFVFIAFYAYLLKILQHEGYYYGHISDIEKRVKKHSSWQTIYLAFEKKECKSMNVVGLYCLQQACLFFFSSLPIGSGSPLCFYKKEPPLRFCQKQPFAIVVHGELRFGFSMLS